jgi:hypothetical protein
MRPSTRERYSGRALTRISTKEVYVFTRLESIVIHGKRTIASISAMCVRSSRETTCMSAWSHRRSCGIGEGAGASSLRADFLTLNWSTSESYCSRLPCAFCVCQKKAKRGGMTQTSAFCCKALRTNERCMSFLNCSSSLILEFVAMGRDGPSSKEDDDAFRVRPLLLLLLHLSNIGDLGCINKSICLRELRAFGVRWLNWVSLECGSMIARAMSLTRGDSDRSVLMSSTTNAAAAKRPQPQPNDDHVRLAFLSRSQTLRQVSLQAHARERA